MAEKKDTKPPVENRHEADPAPESPKVDNDPLNDAASLEFQAHSAEIDTTTHRDHPAFYRDDE